MKERLRTLLAEARLHSYWIALGLATVLVLVAAAAVSSTALQRADSWRTRVREIVATDATIEVWQAELVPPPAAESAAWRASEQRVRARGIDASDRVALMQLVAQRAEELGIGDVRTGFVASDTLRAAGREVGDASFEVAPYALVVRFTADYEAVASLLGALPPQVELHRLLLGRAEGGGVEAELLLVVYLGSGGEEAE